MELFDALRKRRSVRSYTMQVPGNRIQVDLLNYLNNIPVLLPEADIAIELLSFEDLLDYFPNQGPQMIHAPLYLVFKGNLALYQLMNVGYYGQHASIWLTSKGLGSVWQSGFVLETLQEDEFVFEEDPLRSEELTGEESLLPIVLALGYPGKGKQATGKPKSKAKLQHLILTPGSKLPQNDLLSLMDAGRLAPSEYNAQPWRFFPVGNDMIHLFMKPSRLFRSPQRSYMQEAAIGCAIGNMEIMAALKGMEMEYGFMPQVPSYGKHSEKMHYMGTIRTQKVYKQMMFGFNPGNTNQYRPEDQFY